MPARVRPAEERTAGREAEEGGEGRRALPPCFEKSLGVRGLFGEQLERERMLRSKGRRFLKSSQYILVLF